MIDAQAICEAAGLDGTPSIQAEVPAHDEHPWIVRGRIYSRPQNAQVPFVAKGWINNDGDLVAAVAIITPNWHVLDEYLTELERERLRAATLQVNRQDGAAAPVGQEAIIAQAEAEKTPPPDPPAPEPDPVSNSAISDDDAAELKEALPAELREELGL